MRQALTNAPHVNSGDRDLQRTERIRPVLATPEVSRRVATTRVKRVESLAYRAVMLLCGAISAIGVVYAASSGQRGSVPRQLSAFRGGVV